MTYDLQARKKKYFALSSRLAHVDGKQLDALFGDTAPAGGWGRTHTIKLGSSKVFVKRVPLTDLEYETPFSTENLYNMPTFYNYGVGSAGFGGFRELVAHIKTTNWVLSGAIANFPLMYHYRIAPFAGKRQEIDLERHQGYVKYWNGDENIDRYIRSRHTAKHELIIFLEHFPHVLSQWLVKNMDRSAVVVSEMQKTTKFLREHGVIHFDAHFHNILVDGEIPYLTDFGLVLDKSFALDSRELEFFKRHIDYDDAEVLSSLGSYMGALYRSQPASAKRRMTRKYGLPDDLGYADLLTLLENIKEIHAGGLMKLDEGYIEEVTRYRGIINCMFQFYGRMRGNDKKDTPYERSKIRRLLREADNGVLS